MSYMPCENPSCKSYGKPHPNCHCYSNMAEGGEVTEGNFCSQNRTHKPDCEYAHDGKFSEDFGKAIDHGEHVAGYLAKHGLTGILKFTDHDNDEHYEKAKDSGHKLIDKHIKHLFEGGSFERKDRSHLKKVIHDWVDKGGASDDLREEAFKYFAHGGGVGGNTVHNSHVATSRPEQNLLMQAIKGRASQYLGNLKPQPEISQRLPFDSLPNTTKQKKMYDNAVGLANDPMTVMDKIKKGSLDAETNHHFTAMFPEMKDNLQKRLTQKITEGQVAGQKPPYALRQGLSQFMGTPLMAEMTQPRIQAAQSVFSQAPQNQPAPAGGEKKSKSKPSVLTKSSQAYLTQPQASAMKDQKIS